MKRILILTVTAGNGHNACAKAMKEKLESEYDDVEVKIIDLLKTYSSAIKIWVADKGYSIAFTICSMNTIFRVSHRKDIDVQPKGLP